MLSLNRISLKNYYLFNSLKVGVGSLQL